MDFPDNEDMHACTETIYQTIYIQGKGELGRELNNAPTKRHTTGVATAPRIRPSYQTKAARLRESWIVNGTRYHESGEPGRQSTAQPFPCAAFVASTHTSTHKPLASETGRRKCTSLKQT